MIDYDSLDDEYGNLPSTERIIKSTKMDRDMASLSNLHVYNTNKKNGATRRYNELSAKLKSYE